MNAIRNVIDQKLMLIHFTLINFVNIDLEILIKPIYLFMHQNLHCIYKVEKVHRHI